MGNTIDDQLAAKVQEAAAEKQVIAKANATPLPGALAEAFSPCQDIEVGEYKVRPFYDLDFEILQMMNHPMAMDSSAFFAKLKDSKITDLRGKDAWLVCWLLTNTPDEVDEVAEKGNVAIATASKKAFSRKQIGDIFKVQSACIEQFARYFSTVIGLVEADKEDSPAPKE